MTQIQVKMRPGVFYLLKLDRFKFYWRRRNFIWGGEAHFGIAWKCRILTREEGGGVLDKADLVKNKSWDILILYGDKFCC